MPKQIACWCCNKHCHPPPRIQNLKSLEILNKYTESDVATQTKYVETHFPRILEGAIKFPETKFYLHGSSPELPEPDLVGDQYLDAHRDTIRNRQTEQAEENVARNFLFWANNTNTLPCLVLSGVKFAKYLNVLGCKELKQFYIPSADNPADDPSRGVPLRAPQLPAGDISGLLHPQQHRCNGASRDLNLSRL